MNRKEADASRVPIKDDEEKALEGLIDAFGSTFSPAEIASAYVKADQNAHLAGEILHNKRVCASVSLTSNGGVRVKRRSRSSYRNNSEKSRQNETFKDSKEKWHSVSVGTVSSVAGKNSVRTNTSVNGICKKTKPLKLNSKVMPISKVCGEEGGKNSAKDCHLHKNVENFLYGLLGVRFKLKGDVIRQVLGTIGYDLQKTMEKLLELSAATSNERNHSICKSTDKVIHIRPKSKLLSCQRNVQDKNLLRGNGNKIPNADDLDSTGDRKTRNNVQKDILPALFSSPDKKQESRQRKVTSLKSSRGFGNTVYEPPVDSDEDPNAFMAFLQQDNVNADDEDDSFHLLRKAIKEYRGTVKEYYKAAVDAFAEGDHIRAGKLLEQGQFFQQKAQDADEESSRMILQTRNEETEDEMKLDLHEHDAKEAVQLLKCHISAQSGIPSITHLKVIIDTNNEEDTSKGSRRRLIMKFLERRSIKWVEEGNGGTILIHLDSINRKRSDPVKSTTI